MTDMEVVLKASLTFDMCATAILWSTHAKENTVIKPKPMDLDSYFSISFP